LTTTTASGIRVLRRSVAVAAAAAALVCAGTPVWADEPTPTASSVSGYGGITGCGQDTAGLGAILHSVGLGTGDDPCMPSALR
jgi:hypothetical protein